MSYKLDLDLNISTIIEDNGDLQTSVWVETDDKDILVDIPIEDVIMEIVEANSCSGSIPYMMPHHAKAAAETIAKFEINVTHAIVKAKQEILNLLSTGQSQVIDADNLDKSMELAKKIYGELGKDQAELAKEMDLTFVDNQGKMHGLNPNLVKKQKLSTKNIAALKELHIEMQDILQMMEEINDERTLSNIVIQIEAIEFEMQEQWGFPQDANYHSWWLKAPGCTCPKLDNREPIYYGRGKIISGDCPLHSGS